MTDLKATQENIANITVKIISYNINGLKSIQSKQKNGQKLEKVGQENVLQELLRVERPHILCLQEIRCSSDITFEYPGYPYIYTLHSKRKGYAGVKILSTTKANSVTYGLKDLSEDDKVKYSGRLITLEFNDFFLINAYCPNSGGGKLEYRIKVWEPALRRHVYELQKVKPVIIASDMNVISSDWDKSKSMSGCAGDSNDEKEAFYQLLVECSMIDSFRALNPKTIEFSWLCPLAAKRGGKRGCRLDYFLVSERFMKRVKTNKILTEYRASDHLPCVIDFIL